MGTMFYGAARMPVRVEDGTLVLLRMLAATKFRRHEGFMLSWSAQGDGDRDDHSVWLYAECDLHFAFTPGVRPVVERDVLEAMSIASNSGHGLDLDDATHAWRPSAARVPGDPVPA